MQTWLPAVVCESPDRARLWRVHEPGPVGHLWGEGRCRLGTPVRPGASQRGSAELSDALAAAVGTVLADGAGAIVLTADRPCFAPGIARWAPGRDVPLGETDPGFEAFAHVPVPTVAAVGGPAIGAGLNLPLACDVIIVSERARSDPCFFGMSASTQVVVTSCACNAGSGIPRAAGSAGAVRRRP